MKHRGKWIDTGYPLFKYTDKELQAMSEDEFLAVLEENNKYVREKHKHDSLNESQPPQFNTIEELRAYYHCRPLDEAINIIDKLFED